MPRGGAKPGEHRGGRKPGTRNRRTEEQAQAVAESGLTPLEFLVSIMRNPKIPRPERIEAAKAAAPFVHPKLSSIEAKVNGEFSYRAVPVSVEERESDPLASPAGTAT